MSLPNLSRVVPASASPASGSMASPTSPGTRGGAAKNLGLQRRDPATRRHQKVHDVRIRAAPRSGARLHRARAHCRRRRSISPTCASSSATRAHCSRKVSMTIAGSRSETRSRASAIPRRMPDRPCGMTSPYSASRPRRALICEQQDRSHPPLRPPSHPIPRPLACTISGIISSIRRRAGPVRALLRRV